MNPIHDILRRHGLPVDYRSLPMGKEVPMKWFCYEQAAVEFRTPAAIWERIYAGKYPFAQIRRVNKRVVFVSVPASSHPP